MRINEITFLAIFIKAFNLLGCLFATQRQVYLVYELSVILKIAHFLKRDNEIRINELGPV